MKNISHTALPSQVSISAAVDLIGGAAGLAQQHECRRKREEVRQILAEPVESRIPRLVAELGSKLTRTRASPAWAR